MMGQVVRMGATKGASVGFFSRLSQKSIILEALPTVIQSALISDSYSIIIIIKVFISSQDKKYISHVTIFE